MAKRQTSITVDEDLWKAARHKAVETGTSVSAFLEHALRIWAMPQSPGAQLDSQVESAVSLLRAVPGMVGELQALRACQQPEPPPGDLEGQP